MTMYAPAKHAEDRTKGLHWLPVSGVQPVAYVARLDDRPLAVLEFVPGFGYRLTTCSGEFLGLFETAEDASAALHARVGTRRGFSSELVGA